jgi:hypothetical protein
MLKVTMVLDVWGLALLLAGAFDFGPVAAWRLMEGIVLMLVSLVPLMIKMEA